MTDPTRTTKLEAVNSMLFMIGEAPVATLTPASGSALFPQASFALQKLEEVNREVQLRGWYFNEEYDYPLTPNGSGYLVPPLNTLKIDQMPNLYEGSRDFVLRDTKMYDKKNRTYVFTETFKFHLVLGFDFDTIPEALRYYIKVRAARQFQEAQLGSDAVFEFTEDDEFQALVAAKEAEAANRDVNIFNTPGVVQVLQRRI